MPWPHDPRPAASLIKLRDQINAAAPNRSKASDGMIGDAAHQSRSSDHNPWVVDNKGRVVTALDITHDPHNGVNIDEIAEDLRKGRDPRIKYVICNRRIFSSMVKPWEWRVYGGSNPHTKHIHISVQPQQKLYDDAGPWTLSSITNRILESWRAKEDIKRQDTEKLIFFDDSGDAFELERIDGVWRYRGNLYDRE